MFKEFLMKKMMERQLKDVPAEQRDLLIAVVQKNPEFFEKIAKEIQEATKAGKDRNSAAVEIMMKHKDELQQLMKG